MYAVYWDSDYDYLMVEDLKTKSSTVINNMHGPFISSCDISIKATFPETYNQLCALLGEKPEFAFARVRQFLACNFSERDSIPDIDDDFNFNLKKTGCQARNSICKYNFCHPVFCNELSQREKQILSLFVVGDSEDEIAEKLFISAHTVHNHIRNMYHKIGVIGKSNPDRRLIAFAHEKNLI